MARLALIISSAFVGMLVSTGGLAEAQPPVRSGYSVAWYDEFDGNSLKTNLWRASSTNITTNNSQQDYLPSQISVSGGTLKILSENIPSRGQPYRSGLVESISFQKEGRWDVRAKLPTSTGMWPAIWLLSDTDVTPWPSAGEIDIMENRGNEPNIVAAAFHYGENGGGVFRHEFVDQPQTAVHNDVDQNYHDSFHTYSLEWDSDQLRFYVDDVHHWTVHERHVENFLSTKAGAMRLILNTAIGGQYLENPNASTVWPQQFEIDYVHVYNKTAGGPTLTFDNGGFENNGGSLASWSKFGDALNNVSSSNQRIATGSEAMKLYGQFSGDANFSGVTQGISVTPGQELTASASAYVASNDSIAGSNNDLQLKFDYFSKLNGEFGSGDYLGSDSVLLVNGNSLNDVWLTRDLNAVVPAGAVEARVVLVFAQRNNASGAAFVDDVTVSIVQDVVLGDVNQDGVVNFLDIVPFITLLSSGQFFAEADCNQDGVVSFLDISSFISILSGN